MTRQSFLLLMVVLSSSANTPAALAQENTNPATADYYFVFQARDANNKKLFVDAQMNIPKQSSGIRVVKGAKWDPDLVKDEQKDWNGRYTMGPKKLKVANAKLPAGVADFPFQ